MRRICLGLCIWRVMIAPNGQPVELAGCRILGRLPPRELSKWYGRAAIYALPARYEPFGLSVLEAALSGCALVLGDIESLRETWGDAAVFVPPDDHAKLTGALRELMSDPRRREALARRSAARAKSFTPELMAADYLDAYGAAVGLRRMACVL